MKNKTVHPMKSRRRIEPIWPKLLSTLFDDLAQLVPVSVTVDWERDKNYALNRLRSQGLSFWTHDLSSLGRAFDTALATDCPFECPPTFKRQGSSPLPQLLFGLFAMVLDPITGVPVDLTSPLYVPILRTDRVQYPVAGRIEAVRAIRQVCFMTYKLVGACDPMTHDIKIREYITTDAELAAPVHSECWEVSNALDWARTLVHRITVDMDTTDIEPKHGPGALATRERPWEKMNFSRIYETVEPVYPFMEYMRFNLTHVCDWLSRNDDLRNLDYPVSRMALVPKDVRGPRVICLEPLELQWLQQGLSLRLREAITSHKSPARGLVNFESQRVNQHLAIRHSQNGDYITIDLKDASDRVSVQLIELLFDRNISTALLALRSHAVELPDGTELTLNKYASMGSALCFPVEALCFWALAQGAVLCQSRNFQEAKKALRKWPVYAYGDDLVVPKQWYDVIKATLEASHLRLSPNKCCLGRFFRESCGTDAYGGAVVTPVKVRHGFPGTPGSSDRLSWVAYSNALVTDGRWFRLTSALIQQELTDAFGPHPIIAEGATYPLGFVVPGAAGQEITQSLKPFKTRYNRKLCRSEVRLPVISPVLVNKDSGEGWSRLLARPWSVPDRWGVRERVDPSIHVLGQHTKLTWDWMALDKVIVGE